MKGHDMLSSLRSIFVTFFISIACFQLVVQAQSSNSSMESRADAEQLLLKAVKKVSKEGKNSFAAINDPKGEFVKGELYVFIVGKDDGLFYAHGIAAGLIGTDAKVLLDPENRFIIQEMLTLAKQKESGQISYVWKNPSTNKLQAKTTRFEVVNKYIVAVGFYN